MKKLFFSLLLCVFTLLSNAQEWAPIGAKWTYGTWFFWGPAWNYCEWTSVRDTMVQGKNCRLIQKGHCPVDYNFFDKLITYEDSNIVYWYNSHISQFTVLYDFNKTTGESWITKIDTCELLVVVDSVAIDTINGFPLKILFLDDEGDGCSIYAALQYIGSLRGPMPPNPETCDPYSPHYGYFDWYSIFYKNLRCYEDTVIGFHKFDTLYSTCNYVGIHEVQGQEAGLTTFPNPFSSTFNLTLPDNVHEAELHLYDITGKEVQVRTTASGQLLTVHAGQLPAGIYFAEVRDKAEIIGRAKVIRE